MDFFWQFDIVLKSRWVHCLFFERQCTLFIMSIVKLVYHIKTSLCFHNLSLINLVFQNSCHLRSNNERFVRMHTQIVYPILLFVNLKTNERDEMENFLRKVERKIENLDSTDEEQKKGVEFWCQQHNHRNNVIEAFLLWYVSTPTLDSHHNQMQCYCNTTLTSVTLSSVE